MEEMRELLHRQSTDTQPTPHRLSTIYRPTVHQQNCWLTDSQLMANSWPTGNLEYVTVRILDLYHQLQL